MWSGVIHAVLLVGALTSFAWGQGPRARALPGGTPSPPVARPLGAKPQGWTPEIEDTLRKLCAAYAKLTMYRDSGQAVVTQTQGRVRTTTESPMELAFRRPNLLRFDGGHQQAVCDGSKLTFVTAALKQYTDRPAPASLTRASLPSGSVLGGIDEGHPEILDLLTNPSAFDAWMANIASIEAKPATKINGADCSVLAYSTVGRTRITLHIDSKLGLLRKVEGEADPAPATPTEPALDAHVRLVYDFGEVVLDGDLPSLTLSPPSDYRRVEEIGAELPGEEEPTRVAKAPEAGHLLGKPMPAFQAKDLAGKPFSSDELKDQAVLLFFWSHSGSEHSLTAIPVVQAVADRFRDQAKFRVLAVNTDPDPEPTARLLLERKQAKFRGLTDEHRVLRRAFGLGGVPTFILVDAQGVMRWAKLGAPPGLQQELVERIEAITKP